MALPLSANEGMLPPPSPMDPAPATTGLKLEKQQAQAQQQAHKRPRQRSASTTSASATAPASPAKADKDKDDAASATNTVLDAACPICLCHASESPDEPFSRLSCAHEFHRVCLNVWLEKHVTCPICRQLVTNKQTVAFLGHQVVRLTKRETLTQRAFRYARFVGAFDSAQEATLEFTKDCITLTQLYSKNWCFGQRRVSKNLMCGPPLENLTQFSVLNDILVLCRKVQTKKNTFELFAMRFPSIANCCASFEGLRQVLPSRLTSS